MSNSKFIIFSSSGGANSTRNPIFHLSPLCVLLSTTDAELLKYRKTFVHMPYAQQVL